MPIVCELRPLRGATTDQLKRLGIAVKAWADRELGKGILVSIDPESLASLLMGEPPKPLGLRVKQHHEDASWERIREDLGAALSERSLRFTVKDEPRGAIIESLRQAIPAELVEDILIDDASWTE